MIPPTTRSSPACSGEHGSRRGHERPCRSAGLPNCPLHAPCCPCAMPPIRCAPVLLPFPFHLVQPRVPSAPCGRLGSRGNDQDSGRLAERRPSRSGSTRRDAGRRSRAQHSWELVPAARLVTREAGHSEAGGSDWGARAGILALLSYPRMRIPDSLCLDSTGAIRHQRG